MSFFFESTLKIPEKSHLNRTITKLPEVIALPILHLLRPKFGLFSLIFYFWQILEKKFHLQLCVSWPPRPRTHKIRSSAAISTRMGLLLCRGMFSTLADIFGTFLANVEPRRFSKFCVSDRPQNHCGGVSWSPDSISDASEVISWLFPCPWPSGHLQPSWLVETVALP